MLISRRFMSFCLVITIIGWLKELEIFTLIRKKEHNFIDFLTQILQVFLFVDLSKYDSHSQLLSKRKKVNSGNLKTNKLFERRPKEEESTELLLDDSEYRHKIQRPEGFESLCQSDPSCPEGCDACCQLPYHNKTGKDKIFWARKYTGSSKKCYCKNLPWLLQYFL